ncbi:MAG: transporter [Verrucomicrobiales bacterium]|nr:transporter [Verrucomicrobiales bacterium]
MSDHTHHAGGGMLSYRYQYMSMSDNFKGRDKISDAQMISPTGEGYMVTPISMEMHMHMLGGMWAPHDKVTLMLMAPYMINTMDHLRRDGFIFNTETEGFGDLRLSALTQVMDLGGHRINLNFGLSAPTGSITEKGFVPGPGNTQLPYPMQLGSGSWGLLPGLSYLGQSGKWSWGTQFLANLRLDTNSQGYRLGDEYSLSSWGAYRWSDWISASLRVVGTTWDDIRGEAKGLMIPPSVIATADPSLRGGERVDVLAGINLYVQEGWLKGHRLALEVGGPVYQDLNGPQLGNQWMMMLGWQKAW